MLVCLVSVTACTNKQSLWLRSFPVPWKDTGGDEKQVPGPFFSTSGSSNLCHWQRAFHEPRMNGHLHCWLLPLLPFSCIQHTPKETSVTFWVEGNCLRSFGSLWIAYQVSHLLIFRCTLCIFIITIRKKYYGQLINYIKLEWVRLDFISVCMTITFFCFHYAFHAKISINFCVSSPIFSHLHFNYSTFDIPMIQYKLRIAFSLKFSASCVFLQFFLLPDTFKILSPVSWVTSQLGTWSWNTYTHNFL